MSSFPIASDLMLLFNRAAMGHAIAKKSPRSELPPPGELHPRLRSASTSNGSTGNPSAFIQTWANVNQIISYRYLCRIHCIRKNSPLLEQKVISCFILNSENRVLIDRLPLIGGGGSYNNGRRQTRDRLVLQANRYTRVASCCTCSNQRPPGLVGQQTVSHEYCSWPDC